ncbi:lipid A biosynthesis acyltransferase [Solitalea longa]|uniref:Lipid A biosynthesis acyltransferase n=1 Tax=Solitalea longa TaxID=2079460 RepID=A0A2S5A2K3_9SPHI|nr:lipid A biosynthesis acyltransferase [Solitalea longa]POY36539.1 lipid A biosynthesis acyltransferase [Solitalea longa]
MPTWQGKSKGSQTGYRIFVFVLKKLGLHSSYFLLRFVALYYFFFSYKSSKPLFQFFKYRLGFKLHKAITSLYHNYYQFGQSLIDKVAAMAGIANQFTFHFDGEEHLFDIIDQNRGGILLSAHLGNWEIAGHLLQRLNTTINIVMFDGEHQKIKDYLKDVVGERKVKVIVIKNDISHIYAISEAFRNNELVCMHADRFLEGNKTFTHSFLGKDAQFPMGPFVLASKFKVPVSYVFAVKESSSHYHFFATKGNDYAHVPKAEVMNTMLGDYVNGLENKVHQYPLQWFNYYDFWKN